MYRHYPDRGPIFHAQLEHMRDTICWLVRHREALGEEMARDALEWSSELVDGNTDYDRLPKLAAFSWSGRTVERVRVAIERLHLERSRSRTQDQLEWTSRGWDWMAPDENHPESMWRMRELLSTEALICEGAAQRHCVAAYSAACHDGRSAIFQLIAAGLRCLTVEVRPSERRIVQVRGRFNSQADPKATEILRRWAQQYGLAFDPESM
jgi:hypothetical protein